MDKLYGNIKKKREELGLTQRELAALCGYSDHTTIARIEQGQVDVSIGRLKKIAAALNTSLIELTGWLEDEIQ